MSQKIKIMVVEDERIVAQDIQSSLESLGYDVPAVVSSGEEAIEKAGELEPDLILMDIVLRGKLNGIETTKQIHTNYDIPVIYLTAYADTSTLDKAKKTEPFGYILKPFEDRELQSTIEMALYKSSMEKQLKQSEEWLSTTLNSIGDGVIATDCDEKITFMNPIAEALTGWSGQGIVGKSLEDIFRVVDAVTGLPAPNLSKRVLARNSVVNRATESVLVAKSGKEIPIDESGAPIRDSRGHMTGVVLVFQDITLRKQAEEALRESEERYRKLFEDSRDAIYITTRDGNFVAVNNATLELLGLDKQEISRLKLQDLYVNPADKERFIQEIETTGSVRDFEIKLKNKSGTELDCLLTSSVKLGSKNEVLGYQGIIRDITEKKKIEEEKKKIQSQLFRAQKMEAIGILAGGVAHDLNNLMTAVQGFTEMSLMQLSPEDRVYQDLQEVLNAAERATNLTRQLLLFSRKQPMELRTVNLNRPIEELLKMLHRLIGEDVGIITSLEKELWPVRCDAGNMEQVIVNLSLNARDAMPKGGKLIIKTENKLVTDPSELQHSEAEVGKYVVLSVIDNGYGMAEETLEHIFEPFYSTKGPGKGTGLGLSVVYGIIQQHGGFIRVESKANEGTKFQLYFPAVEYKSEDTHKTKPQQETYYGKGERILVVEDETAVRELVQKALNATGYHCSVAGSAEEAIQIFERENGSFDLVLSDVVLPGRNGVELLEFLTEKKTGLKFILSSGYPDKKSQWSIIQERGYRFLQKSYTLPALFVAIRNALDEA